MLFERPQTFSSSSSSDFLIYHTDIMEPSSSLSKGRMKFCSIHKAFYQGSKKSALGFKLANIQEFFCI